MYKNITILRDVLRIVSWNVNGLRAVLGKGFLDIFDKLHPDVVCLQEIKASSDKIPEFELPGYKKFYNSAKRPGYSGTAVFSKISPTSVTSADEMDGLTEATEGRVILAEYESFYLVNVYTPNSGAELARLSFREEVWDVQFRKFLQKLANKKPVVVCGDFNVAHEEIDLANPTQNHQNAGFTDQERLGFGNILGAGFIDSFRFAHPEEVSQYSWWSYRANARARNVGWRIDYVLLSLGLEKKLLSADIHPEIFGSDHAPVSVGLDI